MTTVKNITRFSENFKPALGRLLDLPIGNLNAVPIGGQVVMYSLIQQDYNDRLLHVMIDEQSQSDRRRSLRKAKRVKKVASLILSENVEKIGTQTTLEALKENRECIHTDGDGKAIYAPSNPSDGGLVVL